jgi:hypothetical protein
LDREQLPLLLNLLRLPFLFSLGRGSRLAILFCLSQPLSLSFRRLTIRCLSCSCLVRLFRLSLSFALRRYPCLAFLFCLSKALSFGLVRLALFFGLGCSFCLPVPFRLSFLD